MNGLREAVHRLDSKVRDVLGDIEAALRRLPRWGVVVIALVAVAIVGEATFLIVQTGGEKERNAEAAEKQLPCTEREAQLAVIADRFAREVRALGTVPPLAKVLEVYDVDVLDCLDLTGDGVDEMVVQLTESAVPDPSSTAGIAAPWAIYQSIDGEWVPTMIRTAATGADVSISDGEVTEVTSALIEGDALCCPSGRRTGTVKWNGEEFIYQPEVGPRGRTIAIADGEAVALAGFPLQEGSLADATETFGPPSTYAPEDEICPAEWRDLGMTIVFANLGGLDPCGVDGRVAGVTLLGLEAREAGWQTQEGARVGIGEERLRELYPDMAPADQPFDPAAPEGELFTLVAAPTELGIEGVTSVLGARILDGTVVGLEIEVGAQGE